MPGLWGGVQRGESPGGHFPRDIPYGQDRIIVRRNKTRWRCREDYCGRSSFTETISQVPARARTSQRLRTQIGTEGYNRLVKQVKRVGLWVPKSRQLGPPNTIPLHRILIAILEKPRSMSAWPANFSGVDTIKRAIPVAAAVVALMIGIVGTAHADDESYLDYLSNNGLGGFPPMSNGAMINVGHIICDNLRRGVTPAEEVARYNQASSMVPPGWVEAAQHELCPDTLH